MNNTNAHTTIHSLYSIVGVRSSTKIISTTIITMNILNIMMIRILIEITITMIVI